MLLLFLYIKAMGLALLAVYFIASPFWPMASPKPGLSFFFFFSFFSLFILLLRGAEGNPNPNYGEALAKSILFFQGQRSGRLPPDQKIKWRADSALTDGSSANVNLTGGYYDAGDNVKFGFPMAFTTTMLSWSVVEYGKRMGSQLPAARAAVRWATDYLLLATAAVPSRLYAGVGDPNADHSCWERPEDMDTPRTVYWVSPEKPGSDIAGETAAALAAASVVFRTADRSYSSRLLAAAKNVMAFAVKYEGKYSDSLGGADELLWGASWLLRATNDASYFNYLKSLEADDQVDIFSWDNKFAGARVLLARKALIEEDQAYDAFRVQAEEFMCRILPNSPSSSTQYTPGGLIFKLSSSNLQYVTSISFLLSTCAKFMASSNHTFKCGNLLVTSSTLRNLAKKQVDYILGQNPLNMSYMVAFGAQFPKKIHHRGSSLPSKASRPNHIGCQDGFQYLNTDNPNPNILIGAVVGGPNQNDAFSDDRNNYAGSEPATYINAPLVGSLAYFSGSDYKD
ncbi:Endoglucanase 11 [Apostasia shenzhenica]|uniref:Endoglucanase n=1 Tax=Apostasia shenzhenica TaxID=1088818 RepID=A0A2I0AGA9_9ASPA|nr:Endoglucanase 11 [Apostasia shenzhenica]